MKKIIIILVTIAFHMLQAINSAEKQFLQQFVKPQSLVFDVGAHTGAKTDLYLALDAFVLCVEPQPACIHALEQKYASHERVQIVKAGLSDQIGTMKLHICSDAPTISTFSEEWQHGRFEGYCWDRVVTVPVTTLDELMRTYGKPFFCKIDVEGFEYHVLKGLSKPIPYISFEFTKELFKNSKACLEHLMRLGYSIFNYALGETSSLVHKKWVSAQQLITEIENHSDCLLWGDIYAHYEEKNII